MRRRLSILFPPQATAGSPRRQGGEGRGREGRGGVGRGEAAGVPAARQGTFLSRPVTFIPGGQTRLQILARAAELVLNDSGKSVNLFGFHLKHRVVTWHACLCSASACARLYFPNTLFRSHTGTPPRGAVRVSLAWNPSRPS